MRKMRLDENESRIVGLNKAPTFPDCPSCAKHHSGELVCVPLFNLHPNPVRQEGN